jgi:DNA-binding transcriptional MerR regulator
MKIIITESQIQLLRRLQVLKKYLYRAIKTAKDLYNKPKNFEINESIIIGLITQLLEQYHPKVKSNWHEITILISGHFNDKLKQGYKNFNK